MANILLIEDDEYITRMINLRLSLKGHDIEAAENGKIGVEKALNKNYDLILMDMHMPVMDGKAATQALRQHNYSGLIVAVTASAMASETEAALKAGCDHFISKPVGDDFEIQINKLLEQPNASE